MIRSSNDLKQGTAPLSLNAAVDLTGSQYCCVNVNSSAELALPSAGGRILGVLYNAPEVGEAGTVHALAAPTVKCGGTVTAGQDLMVDVQGRVITHAGTAIKVGIALSSGAVNQLIRMQIDQRTGPAA